jgi:hypothetical protein
MGKPGSIFLYQFMCTISWQKGASMVNLEPYPEMAFLHDWLKLEG